MFLRILLSFFWIICLEAKPLEVKIKAQSAILINVENGAILYEKNAHESRYPASTTKIATALFSIVKNTDRLDQRVPATNECLVTVSESQKKASGYTLPPYYLEFDGTHFFVKKGEELTIRELLYGSLLVSGNEASNILAMSTSGNIERFMQELNEYIDGLGCKQTRFCNPHGLHHPQHKTTVHDMALIAKEAINNPIFREIVTTTIWERPKTNKQDKKEIVLENLLLREDSKFYYPKAIGIKTGFTKAAGPTFVAAANDENRTLIAVLFGYQDRADRYRDALLLFETAFREKKISRKLFSQSDSLFSKKIRGGKPELLAGIKENVSLEYYPSEEEEIVTEIRWNHLKPPIQKNEQVGHIAVKNPCGRLLLQVPLFAKEKIETSLWQFLFGKSYLAFILGVGLWIWRKRRKKS